MNKQLMKLFLKLGFFAYGGPAAHIAMMNDEVVVKRGWMDEAEFLDMLSFTNIIPGPNSTEAAILIGYKKGGIKGLFIAGISFILPAVLVVILLSMFYVKYESVPSVQNALSGMVPIMIGIIAAALIRMSKANVKTSKGWFTLVLSSILLLLGVNELVVLVVSGIIFSLNTDKILAVEPVSILLLFLVFMKIGALLYGSGYVLISFLESEFVSGLGWLTQSQLYDLVAIGEITPGPVFTTATAIGYYLLGLKGSLVATVGIFVPSFTFILILYPLYEKLKKIDSISKFLSGVSIGSLGIMVNVVISMTLSIKSNIFMLGVALLSIILIRKYKVNTLLLVAMGAILGLIIL